LPPSSASEAAALVAESPSSLPGRRRLARLDNGLTVCLLENRQAPVVTAALAYRAGTRDEAAGHGGTAHFLEHMMFKGSARFGPGEIDRRTQALGGANNAFTSQDLTVYYFNFAADRWTEALAIEADRMSGLTLDPAEVESERQVILEEIAMYDSEPWDALEVAVAARLFLPHPYGRPVLGTRAELAAIDAGVLRDFHRRFYRPDNAVCIVAGDVGDEALAEVRTTLGTLPPGAAPRAGPTPPERLPAGLVRLTRRKGEVARLLLSLPGPAGDHPDHAPMRLLTTLLAGGRTSRLHRLLVDERQECVFVAADLNDNLDVGQTTVAAEVVPGVEPARVEETLLAEIADLVRRPPDAAELERARQVAIADWVFGHEKVHEQAVSLATGLALFGLEHWDRHLRSLVEASAARLHEVAGRYLRVEAGAVLGWSLPRAEDQD
jgi:zinc protease